MTFSPAACGGGIASRIQLLLHLFGWYLVAIHNIDVCLAETRNSQRWAATAVLPYSRYPEGPHLGVIRGSGFVDFSNVVFRVLESNFLDTQNDNDNDGFMQDFAVDVTIVAAREAFFSDYEALELTGAEQLFRVGVGRFPQNESAPQTDDIYDSSDFQLCCTTAMALRGECDNPGFAYFEPDLHAVMDVEQYLVPFNGTANELATAPFAIFPVEETSYVAVIIGNCQQPQGASTTSGVTVEYRGTCLWVSYVGGDAVLVQGTLALLHLLLWFWYRRRMQQYAESRIHLETALSHLLAFASGTAVLKTLVFAVENTTTREHVGLLIILSIVVAVKDVASRCLYVSIAMGWGVTAAQLTPGATTILTGLAVVAGTAHIIVGVLRHTSWVNEGLDDIVVPMLVYSSLAFLIWIPCALLSTKRYILNEAQVQAQQQQQEQAPSSEDEVDATISSSTTECKKAQRYQTMFYVFLGAMLLTLVQSFLLVGDMLYDSGRRFDEASSMEVDELSYLVILAAIAFLWRPNPQARDYGYVVLGEAQDDDDDGIMVGTHDLELTEVPGDSKEII